MKCSATKTNVRQVCQPFICLKQSASAAETKSLQFGRRVFNVDRMTLQRTQGFLGSWMILHCARKLLSVGMLMLGQSSAEDWKIFQLLRQLRKSIFGGLEPD